MITYHSNPSLKSVNPNYKGNVKINGRFEASEVPAESPSFVKVLRWQLTPNPQRKEKKIYFAGDSGYDTHFQKIRKLVGDVDICIMPVGAYKPPFMMKEAHMHPAEAVQAFHDLEGKIFIPMHYGTYDLSDEPLGEPLRILHNLEKSGQINGNLKILAIGETYYLS